MTSLMSRALIGASALALTALGAGPASAQNIDRIVAFGDSYADDGNFFAFVGVDPATTVAYTTGRFSGGTNYIDTLGQLLDAPIDNFAIGGALTSQFNTNTGPNLGFPTEYGSFLTGGAGLTPFPSVSGTFGENDLLAISIGGNDARIYQTGSVPLGIPVGTLAGAPAAGAASAAFATAGLDLLVDAGAPTISYLAGNTANIPEVQFKADPANAFAVRDAFFQSFDGAMRNTLAGYAADGVMVHYLDLNLVGQRVQSDFGAYGLTALACPAFPPPLGPGVPGSIACLTGPTDAYLFYGDQLHLTSAGFAIVAQYIAAQLTAPLTLQAPSDLALDTAHQFGRTLTSRMDLGSPRDGGVAEGLTPFIVGDVFQRKVDAANTNRAFDINGIGVTVGLEYGFGSGVAGIAANYSRPEAEFTSNAADIKTRSLQIGAYAGAGFGGGFVQGYAGYGSDDHDVSRFGVIDSMDADTDGHHWIAGAKAGYLMALGGIRLDPVAALDYAKVKVDGYSEDGDAALTLNVDSIKADSLRGSLGAELRADLGDGGTRFRPYGSAVIEKEFSDGERSVHFAQTSAPGIVNSFAFDDISKKAYGRFTGGASAAIVGGVTMDASLSFTAGKQQGEETSAHVGLSLAL